MKKFMRIALVFALAGATLMYTGCTKDYSGDISDLNNQLGKQEAAITTLQAQVNAAQTTANEALEAAKKADDKAAIAELEARIKKLEEAQAKIDAVVEQIKKDTKADVEKALAEIKAEVDALIESLGITSLEVLSEKSIHLWYARWDGPQEQDAKTGKWGKAEWKGPRAEEAAAEVKGDYVVGNTRAGHGIIVQVNPTTYDLSESTFAVENSIGDVAPIAFGKAFPFEGLLTKSENGLWEIPYSAGEGTGEMAKYFEWLKSLVGKRVAFSLVANGSARTAYDLTFSATELKANEHIAEFGGYEVDFEDIDGSFTAFATEYASTVYDAYLTCEGSQVVKYNIKPEGLSFSYDKDAVIAAVNKAGYLTLNFAAKVLNIAGRIYSVPVTVTFFAAEPEPYDPVIIETAIEGVDTVAVVGNPANQITVVSAANLLKEVGEGDVRALWAETFTEKYAKLYAFDQFDDPHYVSDLDITLIGADGKPTTDSTKFTAIQLKFNENYTSKFGESLPFDDDYFAVVTFYNPNAGNYEDGFDSYVLNVPVYLVAPTAEEINSWYKWSAGAENVSVVEDTLTYLQTNGNALDFDFFSRYTPVTNKDGKVIVESELNVAGAKVATDKSKWSLTNSNKWLTSPEFTSEAISESVKGLKINALNGRTFPINNIKVIVKNVAAQQEPTISFNPETLELGYATGSFEVLTNSVYEPYYTPEAFYGTFTLKDANGKELYISKPSTKAPYRPIQDVKTYKKDGDNWVPATGLITVDDQAYDTNFGTSTTADIKPAYGLKISAAQDLFDYYGQQIKVEVTFDEGGVNYVATKEKVAADFTVSFFVTIK